MADAIAAAIVGGMSDIDIEFTNDAREFAIATIREKRAWAALCAYRAEDQRTMELYDTDEKYRALIDAWEVEDDAERALRKKMVAAYGDLV